jgi:NADH-quinone oxidoreductase subunit J
MGHALVEQGLGTRIAARFSDGRLPPLPGGIGQRSWPSLIDSLTNIQSLGYLIYTYYFYYFLMAGMVLLTAMIGAIVLTMHKRKNASSKKKQLIFKQIARNFENSVAYGALPNGRAPLLDVCERGGGL